MSIRYYGLPKRDTTIIGPTVEGTLPNAATIDVAMLRSAIKRRGLELEDDELKWEGEGSYILVAVLPTYVAVTHGTRGGDAQTDLLCDILDTLTDHGLHVWDAQQESWLPP